MRVDKEKIDNLVQLVSEMVVTQARLNQHFENNYSSELELINEDLEKLSQRLRSCALGMSLVPVKTLFSRFNRLIRDLSMTLDKDVQLRVSGEETELDKTIIDKLVDPIMHIVRNSMDHGLESKEERSKTNKDKVGVVSLNAYYSGVNVVIQIKDDGKGLNVNKIREIAINKGVISETDDLSDSEIKQLIFASGFSTAEAITDISGRGVGMDVVMQNIKEIKGEIFVESEEGEGTTVTIQIPLTLSIVDGLLLGVENKKYVIPIELVGQCYEIKEEQLTERDSEYVIINDQDIPYIDVRETFNIKKTRESNIRQLIIVDFNKKKIGLIFDDIIGIHQAVIKPIGKFYIDQDFISGASILGDGDLALMLDTNRLIKEFIEDKELV